MLTFNDFIGRVTNGMTLKEALAFKSSKKYWEIRFSFDSHPMNEPAKMIGAFYKEECQQAWDEAKRMGEADESFLELCLVDQGLVPPTFTKVAFCANCGHVPVNSQVLFSSVSSCVWCGTGLFNFNTMNGGNDGLNF